MIHFKTETEENSEMACYIQMHKSREAAWPSGLDASLKIRRSRVQILFWLLADVVVQLNGYACK